MRWVRVQQAVKTVHICRQFLKYQHQSSCQVRNQGTQHLSSISSQLRLKANVVLVATSSCPRLPPTGLQEHDRAVSSIFQVNLLQTLKLIVMHSTGTANTKQLPLKQQRY